MIDPTSIQAVLFDVDGTLLDTFEFIYRAFEQTFEKHGLRIPSRDEIGRNMGGPLWECYSGMTSEVDPLVLCESHRSFQVENIDLVRLFPSTVEVLESLTSRGLKLAAITTRSIRSSVRSMEETNIARYFATIISAEDVQNLKPHPEPLLLALDRIGCEPRHALMVGDTYADIEAGQNAGTQTVLAHYGFGPERGLAAKPDVVIHDLRELLDLLQ